MTLAAEQPGQMTPQQIVEAAKEFMRAEAKRDLYFCAKVVLGYDWLVPHIHMPLCRILERWRRNPRMKITLPRGWLKSTLCSIAYPIWRAIIDPSERILLVQNTFDNAAAKLSAIKTQWEENKLLRELFADLLPKSKNKWKAEALCLNRPKSYPEATFECAGIRTQLTGRHYTVIIEDDTVAPDKDEMGEENVAPVKEDIEQAIGFHKLCSPLLVDPTTDTVLVVGTRWFEKDLLSWIDEHQGKRFFSYTRACRETNGVADENGAITYPERFGPEVLEGIREDMGPYLYNCLYMNQPTRSEDMIFRKEWFQYFSDLPATNNLVFYTAVDPAGDPKTNKSKKADFNVVITAAKCLTTGFIFVVEASRGKWNPGQLIDCIFRHVRQYKSVCVGIESNAYQGSLLYWVSEKQAKDQFYFQVEGLSSRGNKESRIMGLQPVVASGKLRFQAHQTWLMTELEVFPLGANDDGADCLSLILSLAARTEEEASHNADEHENVDPVIREAMSSIDARNQTDDPLVYDVIKEAPRYDDDPFLRRRRSRSHVPSPSH